MSILEVIYRFKLKLTQETGSMEDIAIELPEKIYLKLRQEMSCSAVYHNTGIQMLHINTPAGTVKINEPLKISDAPPTSGVV